MSTRPLLQRLREVEKDDMTFAGEAADELERMRTRIESLRGLCMTMLGYISDSRHWGEYDKLRDMVGDMEAPL